MAKRGRPPKKKNDNPQESLILIDHDGTLCETHASAYNSIKFAFTSSCEILNIDPDTIELDWDVIFSETSGTSEKNLVRVLTHKSGISVADIKIFEKRFYDARAKWYENMKSFGENVFDTYYPDIENLIYLCSGIKNIHLALLTGNPRAVIEERLSKHLQNHFRDKKDSLNGAFGDEAASREELLKLAVERCKERNPKFKVTYDKLGFMTNVFYICDSRNDFFAALDERMSTIWIPSRKLQDINSAKAERCMRFIGDFLDERILITNDIHSEETLGFLGLINT